MTHEEIYGEIRAHAEQLSDRRVKPDQIKWWMYHGMKDFCLRAECSQQAEDYTISYEQGAWRQEYPLPGYRESNPTYPYSDYTHAGDTFKRAIRMYIDGELADYTSQDRILAPTATNEAQYGTDPQGRSIVGSYFSGTGEDTSNQYWYIKFNKVWCPYPPVEEAVGCRLHYIWIPDTVFKETIELASDDANRREVASRIPATWHEAFVIYGLYKMFDFLGDEKRRDYYRREYETLVKEASGNFKTLARPAQCQPKWF
jgi:hypothetical protein